MIIKGGSRENGGFFAWHLMRRDENERVTVAEMRGLAARDVRAALREMEFIASGTACENYFYHASMNPDEGEELTPEQWEQATDALERRLGLEGQPRFVVEHEKEGRIHRHVIWGRIDPDTMTARSDSLNYQKHEEASREIEAAFGLAPVASVLVKASERGGPRPERRMKDWEGFRAAGTGIDPDEMKAEITGLKQQCDTGKAFAVALEDAGYILARGDRRDFVIIDRAGDDHSLGRRAGIKAAELRAFMADVNRESLPTVAEAREMARAEAESGGGVSLLVPAGPDFSGGGNTGGGLEPARVPGREESLAGLQPCDIRDERGLAEFLANPPERETSTGARLAQWRAFFSAGFGRMAEILRDETSGGRSAADAEPEAGRGGWPSWTRVFKDVKDTALAILSRGENRRAVMEAAKDAGELAAEGLRELTPQPEPEPPERGKDGGGGEERLLGQVGPEEPDPRPQQPAQPVEARLSIEDELARQFGEAPQLTPGIEDELAERFGDEPQFFEGDDDSGGGEPQQQPEAEAPDPESGPEPDGPDID